MRESYNNNQFVDAPAVTDRPTETRKRGMTFREGYDFAYRQIHADRLLRPGEEYPKGRLHVMLKVMADVYCKGASVLIRVGGEDVRAEDVQFVYHEIGEAEAQNLLDSMEGEEFVKEAAYVRAALYYAGLEAG